jgi:large subunit ribosomal protein L21
MMYKKKQRNTYRRKIGHRQHLTAIRITEILAKGGATEKKAERKAEPTAEARPAAAKKTAAKAAPAKAAADKAPAAKKAPAKKAAKKAE